MKHWVVQLACAAAVMLGASGSAMAQATTYTANVTGPYTLINDFTAPCANGPCQNYTPAMTPSGSFTTSAPLPANLVGSNVAGSLVSFSLFDGVNTYSSADPDVRLHTLSVSTNGAGDIVSSSILVERWLTGTAPHILGNRFSYVQLGAGTLTGTHNTSCANLGTSPAGVADSCLGESVDASRSRGGNAPITWSSAAVVPAGPASPAPIPTASEWGLAALAFLLSLAGFAALRRQHR